MAEIRNPNQQGGSDNRSFIVMLVVLAGIFIGLQFWQSKRTQPLQNSTAQQSTQTAPQAAPPAATVATGQPTAVANASAPPAAVSDITAAAESTTVIDSDLYRVEFTNRGAQVKSWILKRQTGKDGKPLDLVNTGVSREVGFPLSLFTYDMGLNAKLRDAMYVPSTTGTLRAPQTVTFRYSSMGVEVTKTFSFDSTYVSRADILVKRNGAPVRALLSWPSGFGDQDEQVAYNSAQIESMGNGKTAHVAFKDVSGGNTLNGPLDYAGVSGQFFTAIFVPQNPQTATAATFHGQFDLEKLKNGDKPGAKPVNVPVIGAAAGDTSGHSIVSLYAGPKSYEIMKTVATPGGQNLSSVVDFGFFGPIAKMLFFALHFLQAHIVNNWGWAIVIFTIIVNLILLPLRVTSMKSALKMQRLAPQLDAIKAKYAKYKITDPKRSEMGAEQMALYKNNGVNQFAGCIPSLIQLPLLFAMFGMLTKIVELRQAHWFWLHDLTAPDHLRILPIFMVVSQFLVQFYMPSPGIDPQQQKMMAFMLPVFSGYMTWNYASGLALYWSTGNVIMIIQQYVMNRTSLGQEMRAIAAKRARKQQGKVIQGKR